MDFHLDLRQIKQHYYLLAWFLWGDVEKAKIVMNFRHKLSPYGFELYVAKFMEKYGGFKTICCGGMNDGWVDVKWVRRTQDGKKEYLIVQCKKLIFNHIQQNQVAAYYGQVAWLLRKYPSTQVVFVTTSWVTKNAQDFCQNNGIILVDYRGLLEMHEAYPIHEFIDYVNLDPEAQAEKIFDDQNDDVLQAIYDDKDKQMLGIQMKGVSDRHELNKELIKKRQWFFYSKRKKEKTYA